MYELELPSPRLQHPIYVHMDKSRPHVLLYVYMHGRVVTKSVRLQKLMLPQVEF